MSLATLKKKTAAKYNNMSVNKPQFSINGTTRSQGYIGQNVISRSLPKTKMVGNELCGYGGCCGTYLRTPIIQSAVTSTEDSATIKQSSVSTSGMLATKYRWIRRGQPYTSVKPDSNLNNNTAQDNTEKKARNTLYCIAEIPVATPLTKNTCSVPTTNSQNINAQCVITEDIYRIVAKPQSQYILSLKAECILNDTSYIANNSNNTPLPTHA